ncbi:MAG TPA: hypothetical protein VKU83_03870 [Puia sp.]|nr:hypothetical protein [Puia sp.]
MKMVSKLVVVLLLLGGPARAQVDIPRMDSTLKIGKAGYRVECRNRKIDVNQLDIRPVGFDNQAKPVSFLLRGRVAKAEIDDLNGDGYPDLVLYVYTDSAAIYGTVYAFVSKGNKSIAGCTLPDPMMDGHISSGYRGHDQFSLLQGYLLEKFPIYKTGDAADKPTGGTRAILYQLVKGGKDEFEFQQVRHYDTN